MYKNKRPGETRFTAKQPVRAKASQDLASTKPAIRAPHSPAGNIAQPTVAVTGQPTVAKISEPTVASMITIFEFLTRGDKPFGKQGPLLSSHTVYEKCFALGVSNEVLDKCEWKYYWSFRLILPALFDGSFFSGIDTFRGKDLDACGQNVLISFALLLCSTYDTMQGLSAEHKGALHAALRQDGFTFDGNRLAETYVQAQIVEEPEEIYPVEQPQEIYFVEQPKDTHSVKQPRDIHSVEQLIDSCPHDRKDLLLQHLENGHTLYREQKFEPSVEEWRSFFEVLLYGVWWRTRANRDELASYPESPALNDLFLYLTRVEFFSVEEESVFRGGHGFLRAGGHAGIGEKENAYLSQTLALTFGQAILLKLYSWSCNEFRRF
jgi:hypothetical protein